MNEIIVSKTFNNSNTLAKIKFYNKISQETASTNFIYFDIEPIDIINELSDSDIAVILFRQEKYNQDFKRKKEEFNYRTHFIYSDSGVLERVTRFNLDNQNIQFDYIITYN